MVMGDQKIDMFFSEIMGILRLKLSFATGLLRTITLDYALWGIMGKNLQKSILSVYLSVLFTMKLTYILSEPIGNKGMLTKGTSTT